MKKMLSVIIALVASIIIMPVALAEDAVASVGDTYYATLQEAINNADGQTVTLLTNVTESITISEGTTITLDLNGYTLTNEEGEHTITNNGNLTIIGSGTVDNVSHAKAALHNSETGVAVLESGTYTRSQESGSSADNNGGNSYYTIQNYGIMTIKDGVSVLNKGSYSSLLENGFYNGNDKETDVTPTLTIEGGYFSGGLNTIKNDDWGVLIINGGTFENVAQAVVLNWNEATINGGTFESSKYVILNGKIDDTMDIGKLTITGGTFTSGDDYDIVGKMQGLDKDLSDVKISGGEFSKEVPESLLVMNEDEALLQKENGYYVIASKYADYSEVESLIEEANNIDKSLYTEESVQTLEDAINSVDYSKNSLQQDEVDAMALAIQNAIDNLTLIETITPEEPTTPDDTKQTTDDETTSEETTAVQEETNPTCEFTVNPKTNDTISYAYIALLISGLGVTISLKKLA